MNKFALWMKNNEKKQRGVAEKLGISTTTMHEILRKGLMPSLKLAYAIEIYTQGAITVYDWIDQSTEQSSDQRSASFNTDAIETIVKMKPKKMSK
jgi:DNA-binding XRE family transcriptional regulator